MSSRTLRIVALVVIVIALSVIAEATGIRKHITIDAIRLYVHKAGPWGVLLFVLGFIVLEFLHVPGTILFLAGVVIWGPVRGGLLGTATALVSLSVTFVIARAIGGEPQLPERPKLLRRIFEHLQRHPVLTVALLRLVSFMTPTVTYALALSPISLRDMFIGSAIGLVPFFVVGSLFAEAILSRLVG